MVGEQDIRGKGRIQKSKNQSGHTQKTRGELLEKMQESGTQSGGVAH